MDVVDDIVPRLGRDLRRDAGKLLLPVLRAVAGGLTGAAGAAFLTAWAYFTLRVVVGYGPAALSTGLGLTVLAAGLPGRARHRLTKKTAADLPVPQPVAPATAKANFAAKSAFTPAFVFA